MFRYERKFLALTLSFLASHLSCGSAGQSASSLAGGDLATIRGAIVSSTGSQSDMFGYVMVLMERDTGISRVAQVNSGGIFEFKHVKGDAPQTLVLLNASYKLTAVLSIRGTISQTIRQYFTPQASYLPRLIRKGPIIYFEDDETLSITSDTAADANGNGIPTALDPDEGGGLSLLSDPLGLAPVKTERKDNIYPSHEQALVTQALKMTASGPDTDDDDIPNEFDFDLDGDGLINWFDIDMDNNSPIDIFDADADDDILLDSKDDETLKNEYKEGVEYFAVTVERGPNENNVTETKLILKTKIREAVEKITIDAPTALISGAQYDARQPDEDDTDDEDPPAEEVGYVSWDRELRDDGYSEDDGASDGIYGQGVILKAGKKPLAYQTIFLKLDYGGDYQKWYPYVFPSVTLGSFSIAYDANGFRFEKSSSSRPFGSAYTNYQWLVKVYDSKTGRVVWESDLEDAQTSRITDDKGTLEQEIELATNGDPDNGIKPTVLKAVGFAISLEKVPGVPAYNIRSQPVNLN